MAYPTAGYEGTVTSWAGTANTQLLANLKSHTASINISGGSADRTPFVPTANTAQMGGGLRSWSGFIRARYASTPLVGYLGSVTFASGDVLWVQRWAMTIAAKELEFSTMGSTATGAGWMAYRPGLLSWRGNYEGFLDSATQTTLPFPPATAPAAATFTLTTSHTLAGTILIDPLGIDQNVQDMNKKHVRFVGSSTLTSAGASNLFAAGAVAVPDWDSTGTDGIPDTDLVLTQSTGRTLTVPAFWTSISISVDPKAYTDVTINFRGAGALTPA